MQRLSELSTPVAIGNFRHALHRRNLRTSNFPAVAFCNMRCKVHRMTAVAYCLRRMIGPQRPFLSMRALAAASTLQPSTIMRTLKGAHLGPEGLSKLLAVMPPEEQKLLAASIIEDYPWARAFAQSVVNA